jgi:hypothetical protein
MMPAKESGAEYKGLSRLFIAALSGTIGVSLPAHALVRYAEGRSPVSGHGPVHFDSRIYPFSDEKVLGWIGSRQVAKTETW